MCGFYDDEQKIKKGDKALFKGEHITIKKTTHIKENKTMDIVYTDIKEMEKVINIPYKTTGFGLELVSRD